MKREELKLLIKECLVEILQEGIVPTQGKIREARSSAQPMPDRQAASVPAQRSPKHADTMQMIFEDTAKTTLMQQVAADRRPTLAQAMAGSSAGLDEPVAVPGNQAPPPGPDRWELLAFTPANSRGK